MKKVLLVGLILGQGFGLMAQDDIEEKNLVTNPGFETFKPKGKLKKLKSIGVAQDWDSPTGLKADLYSMEAPEPAAAPKNAMGKEYPMDGDNYAGIVAYSYNNKQPRSYIQTQLLGPLTKGVDYCVKFHVSLSDLSKYAVNNLGMYIAKDPLVIETKEDIIFTKEKDLAKIAYHPENKVFNARYNWEPMCAVFKATGKEEYITIGNFSNNKDTKFEKLKKLSNFAGTQVPLAYYYIDKVQVFMLDDPSECDCSNQQNPAEATDHVIYHKDYTSEDGMTTEQQVKLATVYFDVLSSKVESMMEKDVDNIAGILKANESMKIKLHGHSDVDEMKAVIKDPENEMIKEIGMKRAEAVKGALVAKGIDGSRILLKSHDANEPASSEMTNLGKAKNRRVEFKIVE